MLFKKRDIKFIEKTMQNKDFIWSTENPCARKLTKSYQKSSWRSMECRQTGLQSCKKVQLSRNKNSGTSSVAQTNSPNPSFTRRMIKALTLTASTKRQFLAPMTSWFTHSRRTTRIRYSKYSNAIAPKYFKLRILA